jgi:hypothetical protein
MPPRFGAGSNQSRLDLQQHRVKHHALCMSAAIGMASWYQRPALPFLDIVNDELVTSTH